MQTHQYQQLVHEAKRIMKQSADPIHDLAHVKRVVRLAKHMGASHNLSKEDMDTLVLCAWWHDTGRTAHSGASFVFMVMIDDIISSCLLWYRAFRMGIRHKVIRNACNILFAKGFTSHTVIQETFLSKNNRLLYNILADADMIDMISVERIDKIRPLIDEKKHFSRGYKMALWWFLHARKFPCRTSAAYPVLRQSLHEFIEWASSGDIKSWHANLLTEQRVEKYTQKAKAYLASL